MKEKSGRKYVTQKKILQNDKKNFHKLCKKIGKILESMLTFKEFINIHNI